ncbi:MAG: Ca2+-binding EF-hand superfamily protein, partial [Gammaproteobacteria bacterium]
LKRKLSLILKYEVITMKHFSTLATVAILSIAFSANVAARGGENPPEKPDFSTIDTDGDGVISFEEFSAKKPPHGDAQTIFDSIDADGNGEISEQELSDHKPPRRER